MAKWLLPIAAGSLALISILFTWSWNRCLFIPLVSVIPCFGILPGHHPNSCLFDYLWSCLLWKRTAKYNSEGYQGLLYSLLLTVPKVLTLFLISRQPSIYLRGSLCWHPLIYSDQFLLIITSLSSSLLSFLVFSTNNCLQFYSPSNN